MESDEMKRSGIQEYQREVAKKAAIYNVCFTQHPEVLEDLKKMYLDVTLFDPDPIVMAGRVAAHDVVSRIVQLMEVDEHVSSEDGLLQ